MKFKYNKSSIQNERLSSNWTSVFVFVALVAIVFLKCILFHWFCFHSLIVSTIWSKPLEALAFYLPKLVAALLLGAFVFLSKRYRWTVLLNLIIDAWCISNLVYHNANDLLLDVPAMLMAGNLQGFESSIVAFFKSSYLTFFFLTFVYWIFVWKIGKSGKYHGLWFAICISIIELINLGMCVPDWMSYYRIKEDADFDMANGRAVIQRLYGWNGWRIFIPFHSIRMNAMPDLTYYPDYGPYYTYENSILHYGVAMLVYYVNSMSDDLLDVSEHDLQGHYDRSSLAVEVSPKKNLIIILVESLESWPFEMSDISNQVAPNLMDFKEYQGVSSWSRVRSEAKHGVSGDGQMLVSSGMMPINAGAACMLYGDNVWPSYISLYPYSAFVDISNGIWNQREMSKNYGYDSDLFNPEGGWGDIGVFRQMCQVVDTIGEPFVIMGLTGATHSPFDHHDGYLLDLPVDMPKYMREYLECLHVTDTCFGLFWEHFKKSEISKNTTVVVTGDHTVFKKAMLEEFHGYATRQGLNIPSLESYCPLWIYSPGNNQNVRSEELCYQMDIYPTILCEIGCDRYFWHGFGENLRDSVALENRTFTEEEAYKLSNSMIKNDWFKNRK